MSKDRLAEATALLERCAEGEYMQRHARDWLSRPPAQPAAPEPSAEPEGETPRNALLFRDHTGAYMCWIERSEVNRVLAKIGLSIIPTTNAQPATPDPAKNPDISWCGYGCGYGPADHGDGCPAQPAAPDMPEDQRALIDSYMAQPGAPEPERPNDGRSGRCGIRVSGNHWCTRYLDHDGEHSAPWKGVAQPAAPDPIHAILNNRCRGKSLHPEMAALERAEAQLAAVRAVLTNGRSPVAKLQLLESLLCPSAAKETT